MSDREDRPPQLNNDEQKEIEEFHRTLDRDLDEQMLLPEKVTSMLELEIKAKTSRFWKIIFDFQCEKSPIKKSLGIVLNVMATNKRSVLLWSRDGIGWLLDLGGLGLSSINNDTYGSLNDVFRKNYGVFLHRPSKKDDRSGAVRRGGLVEVTKGILRRYLAEEAGGEDALCRTNNKLIALYRSSWRRKRRLARSGQNRDKNEKENPENENKNSGLSGEKKSGVVAGEGKGADVAAFEGKLNNQTTEDHSFPTKEENQEFKVQKLNAENSKKPLAKATTYSPDLEDIANSLVEELTSVNVNIAREVTRALEKKWDNHQIFIEELKFQEILDRVIEKKFFASSADHHFSPTGEKATTFKMAALRGYRSYNCLMEQSGPKATAGTGNPVLASMKSEISVCPEMAKLMGVTIKS